MDNRFEEWNENDSQKSIENERIELGKIVEKYDDTKKFDRLSNSFAKIYAVGFFLCLAFFGGIPLMEFDGALGALVMLFGIGLAIVAYNKN